MCENANESEWHNLRVKIGIKQDKNGKRLRTQTETKRITEREGGESGTVPVYTFTPTTGRLLPLLPATPNF
jgi:hypothetical protein